MVEVKGKKIQPKFTVGGLEKYFDLTGEDLLFDGGNIDTPAKRRAFIYVALEPSITYEELGDIDLKEFTKLFTACLEVFALNFEVDGVKVEDEKQVKKN